MEPDNRSLHAVVFDIPETVAIAAAGFTDARIVAHDEPLGSTWRTATKLAHAADNPL